LRFTMPNAVRDGVFGRSTRYALDGPGIEVFFAPVQTGRGPHPASCTMCTVSYPEVKRPGRVVEHSPPSSVEVKERVELYINSLSGHSWPVLG
jgi:hypothetical protein